MKNLTIKNLPNGTLKLTYKDSYNTITRWCANTPADISRAKADISFILQEAFKKRRAAKRQKRDLHEQRILNTLRTNNLKEAI